jgi:VIT1/CCC1 family predicted Fe2+/Mn2+ transporter
MHTDLFSDSMTIAVALFVGGLSLCIGSYIAWSKMQGVKHSEMDEEGTGIAFIIGAFLVIASIFVGVSNFQ